MRDNNGNNDDKDNKTMMASQFFLSPGREEAARLDLHALCLALVLLTLDGSEVIKGQHTCEHKRASVSAAVYNQRPESLG